MESKKERRGGIARAMQTVLRSFKREAGQLRNKGECETEGGKFQKEKDGVADAAAKRKR